MDVRGFTNGFTFSLLTITAPKHYSIMNEISNVKTTDINQRLLGIFIIKHTKINTNNPKTLFLFIDYRSLKITKYLAYSGKSHYKVYGEFIYNTLSEISKGLSYEDGLNSYVLVPKYYVNNKIKVNVKVLTGYSMELYTLKSDNLPNILFRMHSAINMNSTDFEKDISNINSLFKHEHMLDFNKFSNLSNQKRSYSTDNSKKTHVSQDDSNIDKSVFQTLGLDPSKIHIQKVCMIENKPILWTKGNQIMMDVGSIHSLDIDVIKHVMSKFKPDTAYSVMPLIINNSKPYGQRCRSLSRQIIISDVINPNVLLNHINHSSDILSDHYNEDIEGNIIFRLVPISIRPKK